MKIILHCTEKKESFYFKGGEGLIQEGKVDKDAPRSDKIKIINKRLTVFSDSKPGMYIGSQELRWLASGGEEGDDARELYSNEHKEVINLSKAVVMCNLHKARVDTSCSANRARITALFWATNFRNKEDEMKDPDIKFQDLHLKEGEKRVFDEGYINIREDKQFVGEFLTRPRLNEVFTALCCCAYEACT